MTSQSSTNWHPQQRQLLNDRYYPDHDYRLDWRRCQHGTNADSYCDLELVHYYMGEREYARHTGNFVRAHQLRDKLSDQHGVQICDRTKTFYFGAATRLHTKYNPNLNSTPSTATTSRSNTTTQQLPDNPRAATSTAFKTASFRSPVSPKTTLRNNTTTTFQTNATIPNSPAPNKSEPTKFQEEGAHGHPYLQHPEAGPPSGSVTEAEIHRLLAERYHYKLARQFSQADALQRKLICANVHVDDEQKLWRADGVAFRNIARYTHKVTPGNHTALDDTVIKEVEYLVEQRSKYKSVRLFSDADVIQSQLWKDYRIVIDDRQLEWFVLLPEDQHSERIEAAMMSRLRGISSNKQQREGSSMDRGAGRVRAYSAATPALMEHADVAAIQKLVHQRAVCRAARRFQDADKLLDQLEAAYNVFVDDKRLLWWTVGTKLNVPAGTTTTMDKTKSFGRHRPGSDPPR